MGQGEGARAAAIPVLAEVFRERGYEGASLALLVPAVMIGVDAWKMSCVRGLRVFGVIATVASILLSTLGWLAREGLAFDGLLVARPFVIAAALVLLALLHPRAHPER